MLELSQTYRIQTVCMQSTPSQRSLLPNPEFYLLRLLAILGWSSPFHSMLTDWQFNALQMHPAIMCSCHAMLNRLIVVQVALPDQEHLHQHYRHNR